MLTRFNFNQQPNRKMLIINRVRFKFVGKVQGMPAIKY